MHSNKGGAAGSENGNAVFLTSSVVSMELSSLKMVEIRASS